MAISHCIPTRQVLLMIAMIKIASEMSVPAAWGKSAGHHEIYTYTVEEVNMYKDKESF